MGKKKEQIVVSVLGGNSNGVTGSCTSVSYPKKDGSYGFFLIEFGMIQGENTILGEYNVNKRMIENVDIKNAEYVFLAHSHIDHTGNLGALIPNGFDGKVITTNTNIEIGKKLLKDTAYIHRKNIEYLHTKGKKVRALYSEQDTYAIIDKMCPYTMNEIHILNEYISFRYLHNSHVVGATQIEIYIKKPSGVVKKILYTSDLGSSINKASQPFLENTQMVDTANLVLMEATYGSSSRSFTKEDVKREREELKRLIKKYIWNEQSILIPCFSYGRLQNMMVWLYENYKDTWDMAKPIIIDTSLGNEINNVYRRILNEEDRAYWNEVMEWGAFKFIKEYKSTLAFLSTKTSALILSSSGMISAGRSTLYAKQLLGDSNSAIIFAGYCNENTIGGKILNEKQKTVSIDGAVVLKRCNIHRFYSFSSHAMQSDLLKYIKHINCDKIILHHGSKEAKEELREKARDELAKINKTTTVVCADEGYQVTL